MNETPFAVETSGLTRPFGDREVVKDVELHDAGLVRAGT